ncbi:3'-5' exonuclease [Roseibium sp. Sym1]|uniref:3'-5' exonuclease n=1 Tax=Roseibium sp. Sym1 TaxID=3016006 RepID=UPI0022B4521E|nr:3'-5' exonuclease [Roseibium sp. Sym1]
MSHAIIFDCEFLTAPGAMSRLWGGPLDPDPTVVQIGAVKLSLAPEFALLDEFQVLIAPKDRFGGKALLDPFFTELTGIDQASVDRDGIPMIDALTRFEDFAGDCTLWSWGKDELYLYAISSYIAGCEPALPPQRFGNASALVLKAGVPYEDLKKTTSGKLADYFGLEGRQRRQHDALDDAMSVALSLQHLLQDGRLAPGDFRLPVQARS